MKLCPHMHKRMIYGLLQKLSTHKPMQVMCKLSLHISYMYNLPQISVEFLHRIVEHLVTTGKENFCPTFLDLDQTTLIRPLHPCKTFSFGLFTCTCRLWTSAAIVCTQAACCETPYCEGTNDESTKSHTYEIVSAEVW